MMIVLEGYDGPQKMLRLRGGHRSDDCVDVVENIVRFGVMIVLGRYDESQKLLRRLHKPDGCYNVAQRIMGLRIMIVLGRYDRS